MSSGPVYFNRLPLAYFVTSGYGDTNAGGGEDPWETGSYDLALEMALIENFNIVPYSSVIPPQAFEIPIDVAKVYFQHGAVLETIMASQNGKLGQVITAGVGRVHVYQKAGSVYIGGFAAEYEGNASSAEAAQILHDDLQAMMQRRYNPNDYTFVYDNPVIVSHKISNNYGTVLSALCWITYMFPDITSEQQDALAQAAIEIPA